MLPSLVPRPPSLSALDEFERARLGHRDQAESDPRHHRHHQSRTPPRAN